jgi:hypothetical protein
LEEPNPAALKAMRRGWCLGRAEFKREMLEKMEERMGTNHSGELRLEVAEAKAERIIPAGLKRLGWKERIWQGRLMADSVVPSGLGKCDW